MKFRCPYCKHVIGEEISATCPQCKRTIKASSALRESVEKIKEEQTRERIAEGPRKVVFSGNHLKITSPVIPIGFMMLLVSCILVSKYNKSPYKYSSIEFNSLDTMVEKAANSSLEMAKKELWALKMALEMFNRDCGRYPTTKEGIIALINNPGEITWKGPYLSYTRADPWKHPYLYTCTNEVITLSSGGPDETPGTSDDLFAPAITAQDRDDYNLPTPVTDTTGTATATNGI